VRRTVKPCAHAQSNDPGAAMYSNEMREAIQHASIPTLLMCLVQLTRNERWLEPPYRPARDKRLFPDDSGGLDEVAQEQVRSAMLELLVARAVEPQADQAPIDVALFQRMMGVCVAEEIPPEYVPVLMEELGFADRDVHWKAQQPPREAGSFQVLIIGAGLSGLCAAIKLEQLGIPWTLLEKSADIGGVWLDNDYPDAGVDTPNQFYSYSFAPNNQWSRYFSKRDELLRYLGELADRHAIRQRASFGTEVESLSWEDSARCWRAVARKPDGSRTVITAQAVISAVGQLNRPRFPQCPGQEQFQGAAFHSSRWRHDVPLEGRRVVVVGAGASAMQLMRSVAQRAGHVVFLQRSAQWVLPNQDYRSEVTPHTHWLLAHVPYYREWTRFSLFWRFSDGVLKTLHKDPDWPHPQRAINRANDRVRQLMTDHLREKLHGRPDLIAKLLPDYPPYGKRILLDNDWFETLRRDNVEVVAAGLERFDTDAVWDTLGQRHVADVVVLATGFEAGKMLESVDIAGVQGQRLASLWAGDNPKAYLGITVPGFPNLFCMYGPNTNLGHGGSAIFQLECQIRYITGCMVQLLEQGGAAIDVRQEVHDRYNKSVEDAHEQLVWTHPGTTNWFRNAAGRVFSIMPWRMADYWRMTHDPDLSDYHLISR
jgi:4-hydroxyacetophenone monooxygenase